MKQFILTPRAKQDLNDSGITSPAITLKLPTGFLMRWKNSMVKLAKNPGIGHSARGTGR